MVKTRRAHRKNRKSRRQRGGFLKIGKLFFNELTNEEVKSLLKDKENIYEEPNRLIDEFVAKYSKILLDYLDRSVDYYNSGSSVGKTIPAIPQNVRDQFRYELTADVIKNSKITQTKSKFNQLIYFRFKYLNKDYDKARNKNGEHTVESVAKAILNYFDYGLKIHILGDISTDMKAIRKSIKNAISNQT